MEKSGLIWWLKSVAPLPISEKPQRLCAALPPGALASLSPSLGPQEKREGAPSERTTSLTGDKCAPGGPQTVARLEPRFGSNLIARLNGAQAQENSQESAQESAQENAHLHSAQCRPAAAECL